MAAYNASFDIVQACAGRADIDFMWRTSDEIHTSDGIVIRQVNNVLRCKALSRGSHNLADLSTDNIDFTIISTEMAERKLRSQRQIRVQEPKTNILVYFSGNMLCVGARSRLCAIAGMYQAALLMKNYAKRPSAEFIIGAVSCVNRVFSGNIGRRINLTELKNAKTMTWRYEPDLFPGAVGAFEHVPDMAPPPPGTVLMFESGKFVLVGARETRFVHDAVRILMATIRAIPSYSVPPSTDDMPRPAQDQQSQRRNRMWHRYRAQWTADTGEIDMDVDVEDDAAALAEAMALEESHCLPETAVL